MTVIDDTFNANPDGARARARRCSPASTARVGAVVVTPGHGRAGPEQAEANARFARRRDRRRPTRLVVVGRTNRAALPARRRQRRRRDDRRVVANRDAAVRVGAGTLGAGDAVLYENDLPDHYP